MAIKKLLKVIDIV